MNATIVTAPALEPVTLAEAKDYLRVDSSDEDALIQALIKAAREWVEHYTGRALISQTWDAFWDTWCDPFIAPLSPLQSVTTLKYTDDNGTQQTLANTVYSVDTDAVPGKVWLAYNQTWPTARAIPNTIEMRFISGHGDNPSDVPHSIRTAIKILCDDRWQHRESEVIGASVEELPVVQNLLCNYRVHGVQW